MLPQNIEDQTRWGRILELNLYTESKFKNSTREICDSLGTRLLSIEDLNKCCGLGTLKATRGPLSTQ